MLSFLLCINMSCFAALAEAEETGGQSPSEPAAQSEENIPQTDGADDTDDEDAAVGAAGEDAAGVPADTDGADDVVAADPASGNEDTDDTDGADDAADADPASGDEDTDDTTGDAAAGKNAGEGPAAAAASVPGKLSAAAPAAGARADRLLGAKNNGPSAAEKNTVDVGHYLDRTIMRYDNYMGIGAFEMIGQPSYQLDSSGWREDYDAYAARYDTYSVRELFDAQCDSGVYDLGRLGLNDYSKPLEIGSDVLYNGDVYTLSKVTVNGREVTDLETRNLRLSDNKDVKFYYELKPVVITVTGKSYEGKEDGETHEISGFEGDIQKVYYYDSTIHGRASLDTVVVTEASDGCTKYRFLPVGWEPSGSITEAGDGSAVQVLPDESCGYTGWQKDGDCYILPYGSYQLYYGYNTIFNGDLADGIFTVRYRPGTMRLIPEAVPQPEPETEPEEPAPKPEPETEPEKPAPQPEPEAEPERPAPQAETEKPAAAPQAEAGKPASASQTEKPAPAVRTRTAASAAEPASSVEEPAAALRTADAGTVSVTQIMMPAEPVKGAGEPSEEIAGQEVPLSGPEAVHEEKGVWALVNLLLAVLTVAAGMFMILRKRDDEDRKMKAVRFAGLIPAAASVITFLITEDMSLKMQMTDRWTLVMAVIFAAGAIPAVITAFAGRSGEEEA